MGVTSLPFDSSPLLLNCQNNNISFESEWSEAALVVRNLLYQKNVTKGQWQNLFTTNNRLVTWAEDGSSRLLKELNREVCSRVKNAAKIINNCHDEDSLLRVYINEWNNFSFILRYLPFPFIFIENDKKARNNANKESNANPNSNSSDNHVKRCLLENWNKYVFSAISQKLLNSSMKIVESEREGFSVDSQLIIGVRESFVELSKKGSELAESDRLEFYRENFEKKFLETAERFYKQNTSQVMEEGGVRAYMVYADKKLTEEEHRGRKYLNTSTKESLDKFMDQCVKVLVVEYQDSLLMECLSLIKSNDTQRIKMLYRLINRTPDGIPFILNTLEDYIKSEGMASIHGSSEISLMDSDKYVEQLLALYTKFSNLVRDAFYNDPRFLTVRDKAFQSIVNSAGFQLPLPNARVAVAVESKCPELLAGYSDLLLRKSPYSKKFTSEEVDEKLNNLCVLLKYVTNKDIFMRYYKIHLSRRLILELVSDQEKEESLINRFRELGMPSDFVNRLCRMLQDIEMNKDFNVELKSNLQSLSNKDQLIDCMNVKILNAGAWARSKDTSRSHIALPRELENVLSEVEEFYKGKHSGRKLSWIHQWSTGILTYTSSVGIYDLEVTAFQMVVLFLWDENPDRKLSFETIRLATGLASDADLIRTLLSLTMFPKAKVQLLLTDASPPLCPKNINDCTLFWLNQDFCIIKNDKSQTRGRLQLCGGVIRLQVDREFQKDDEYADVIALRQMRIQEAIVKIVKTRKQITQTQLQTELVDLLKSMFLPAKPMIKEQIEWLIENQYLKRHPDDINTFIYLT